MLKRDFCTALLCAGPDADDASLATMTNARLYVPGMVCFTILLGLLITTRAVTSSTTATAAFFGGLNSFKGAVVFVVVLSTVFLSVMDCYSSAIGTLFGIIIGYVLSSKQQSAPK